MPDDVDMEEEGERDSSEEEDAAPEKVQHADLTDGGDGGDVGDDLRQQLSKSEEKVLRTLRRVDYSWVAVP